MSQPDEGVSYERRKAWATLWRALELAEEITDPPARVHALVEIARAWGDIDLDRAMDRSLQASEDDHGRS